MGIAIVLATAIGVFTLRLFIPTWALVVILVVIGGGYYQFSYKPAAEAAQQMQGN